MSRRLAFVLAGAIVLMAPFGQGGREPLALFILHTLALLCVVLVFIGQAAPPLPSMAVLADPWARFAALAGAGVSLALVSALGASYPLAAALGALDLVVPFALFVSAVRAGPDDRDFDRLRALVVASTSLQALLALLRYGHGGALAAGRSFVNRNHLAAYLNVGLFLALTSACAPSATRRTRVLWGGVAALHLLGVFLLESRGAIAALLTALLVFAVRGFRVFSPRGRTIMIGALLACALGAAGVLGARFARSEDPYRYARVAIWKATSAMIAERPLLGFGPGMFPHISTRFNFPVDSGPVRYGRNFQGAHSGFLTLAAEAGVPAAASILAALLGGTLLLLRARADENGVLLGVGLVVLALLVQGCVEDLQVRPVLTIVPALLAGAAVAAMRRLRAGRSSVGRTVIEGMDARQRSPFARLVGATIAVYLFAIGILLPYWAHREAVMALDLGPSGLPHMVRAAALNPLHPDYRNDLAMAILNSGPLTPEGYARAATDLLEARRLKPIDYRFPLHLARLEARIAARLFDDTKARERAVALYREGVRLAPLDPRPRLELASHLHDMGLPGEALQELQRALVLEPSFLRARVLEASILLDMGRRTEARVSLKQAEATLVALTAYVPDSSYARDIVMDARVERERLAAVLNDSGPSAKPS